MRSLRASVLPSLLFLLAIHLATSPSRADTLAERIEPPPGFTRIEVTEQSFGAWLRELPLRPGRPDVRLFDGTLKRNQSAHVAVFDVDVGARDLQQCADAVIRLRAEYLFHRSDRSCRSDISFRFTSGDPARWSDWRRGMRPRVAGNEVTWRLTAQADESYASFRRYLDTVFTYAGTHSLAGELLRVQDPSQVEPGDVFIQGGFPGHAVIIVDVAENEHGKRVFLLAQSYMPAQDIHLLRNPEPSFRGYAPWFEARHNGELRTPEWRFEVTDLRRFSPTLCGRTETPD